MRKQNTYLTAVQVHLRVFEDTVGNVNDVAEPSLFKAPKVCTEPSAKVKVKPRQ